MSTPTQTPATEIKPFKSERAAKMAMTKAEKAYEAAMLASNRAYREAMEMDGVDPSEYHAQKQAERDAAWEVMQGVYSQAQAQKFWVKSWYCGSNPTRDLIAANMD